MAMSWFVMKLLSKSSFLGIFLNLMKNVNILSALVPAAESVFAD